MGDYKLQYESKTAKCTVCWDEKNKKWLAVSIIEELPEDVREQIKNDEERSKIVLEAVKYR
jgi:non-canonical (house-cleaning) NTP pyrophosphatase